MKWTGAFGAGVALFAASTQAQIVTIEVTGTVVGNGIGEPPLNGVNVGDDAVMRFTVDSSIFDEGVPGDTLGYLIDESSFSLRFDGGKIDVGLLDPFPGTPYFTLVDGFPIADGFFVSTSPFSPGGVALEATPYNANLDLGYVGSTLDSLDVLDALGTYDFGGLTRFGFNIWRIVPDNVVLDIDFEQMMISAVPKCTPGGDVTGDGCVDFEDILLVLANWGGPGPDGDANCHGLVDFADILVVLAEWGDGCP